MASPAHLALEATRNLPPDARWLLYQWLALLNRKLVELTARRKRFLIVEAPVRHGKSLLGTIFFPAWYLGTHPEHRVIVTGHTGPFAAQFGGQIRDVLATHGPRLFGVSVRGGMDAAMANFRLDGHRGGVRAVGVGQTPTGEGGHLIVIDDPIRNPADAWSENFREGMWTWYQGGLRSRLEPDGVILVIMSRWHEDDLSGRLRARMLDRPDDGSPIDEWEVLRLPGLAEAPSKEFPEPDPLGREVGEALCPQRYTRNDLLQLRSPGAMGPLMFEALIQNRPSLPEGNMFKTHWWKYAAVPPHDVQLLRRWDMAATEKTQKNDPDWTAGVLLGRVNGATFIIDARRLRASSLDIQRFIKATAVEDDMRFDGRRVPIIMEEEPGSGGPNTIATYSQVLAAHTFSGKKTQEDKVEAAGPFASQCQAGNVYICTETWTHDLRPPAFVEEFRVFNKGTHDDLVDATTKAYNDMTGGTVTVGSYRRRGGRR